MTVEWTVDRLQTFEQRVADAFNVGKIRAPVHLSDGNEAELIRVFEDVREEDYVFCSWRSHYQCLLKGVPEEDVFAAILAGRSIALHFPMHRIFSSAIVGGSLPIAVGTALASQRRGTDAHVWCFTGDMTAETGIAQTCFRYSMNHGLPITFVIEDNGVSVCTPTREVWAGVPAWEFAPYANVRSYRYSSRYPHAGAGIRVQF